tara:strand:- start:3383 stop:3823 length:441 start_codon:yes stop_codon:yes gene_type:complete
MTELTLSTLFDTYQSTFIGLWLIFATLVFQALAASVSHRKQQHYIPGIVDEQLGHESIVFRTHRTFHNSLENLMMMVGPVFIAILTGMDSSWLAALVWIYAIARIIHMVLYYRIATEKNPSPRSYFYVIGLFANIVLLGMLGAHLV